jgi:hypothetical protein
MGQSVCYGVYELFRNPEVLMTRVAGRDFAFEGYRVKKGSEVLVGTGPHACLWVGFRECG